MKSIPYIAISALCIFSAGCGVNYSGHSSVSDTLPATLPVDNGAAEDFSPKPMCAINDIECGADAESMQKSVLNPSSTTVFQPSTGNSTEAQAILDQALDLCQVSQKFWQADEPENAIQALDQAYALLLSAGLDDNAEISQQKDDLRFMISKRILEIHASRHIVAKGTNTPIPIILNDHVKAEISRFTREEKNFFIQSYKRSGKYRPAIVKSLREAGLPEELSWLPLIESGFKVRALSRAGALGLWQFIPSTGYKFGLQRDRFVDDRLNPERSTQAAIAYLKELHQIFGDWSTVLAAYNCGEGRVLRTIRSQNIKYLDNFWDLYDRLPRETARYVPRFLATLYIIDNMEKFGFDALSPNPPVEFEVVSVTKQVKLKDLSSATDISYEILKELNPELRHNIIPPRHYDLKVPAEKGRAILSNIDKIAISSPPQAAFVYHRVKAGESLSSIARRYRTSVNSIARVNHINKCNLIVAGKILKIPQNRAAASAGLARRSSFSTQRGFKYIVKKGDSLWKIAKQYDTSPHKIRKANKLSSSKLSIGQVLNIPSRQNASKTYLVKSGDSPFTIASRHNMDLNRLLQLNHLTSRSKIYPGQQLFVE